MNNLENIGLQRLAAELRIDTESVAIPIKEYRRLIEAETAIKIVLRAYDVSDNNWDIGTAAKTVFAALWPKPPKADALKTMFDALLTGPTKDEEPAAPTAPAPDAGAAVPEPTPISEIGPAEDPYTHATT